MKVLVTGSDGFIAKNLLVRLREIDDIEIVCFNRNNNLSDLEYLIEDIDFIFHLAGINRPENPGEFYSGNVLLTKTLTDVVLDKNCRAPIIFSSSTQVSNNNEYGQSKKKAELNLSRLNDGKKIQVGIFQLPNVFGKWSRPNYNSVVSTFCHNIVNDLPIHIHDPEKILRLVYVDDIVEKFVQILVGKENLEKFGSIEPVYEISLQKLAELLKKFKKGRSNLIIEKVGKGLTRALYSTYLSYLPKEQFSYGLKNHEDQRGTFVEMLKTIDSGQISFFTAYPGITRGNHYHHSKAEKFLVIKGQASFQFRNVMNGDRHEIKTSGNIPEIVETVPGWTHNITNIGDEELVVMLWANEIFDSENPDTFFSEVF